MDTKIFLLEDDDAIGMGLTYSLEKEGYAVTHVKTCKEARSEWAFDKYDIAILDINLPDGNGYDICKMIKEKGNVPVIFLTASDAEVNVVMGLELGADDYMAKPFDTNELVARVKANLRRKNIAPTVTSDEINVVTFDDLEVNLTNYSVKYKDEAIEMAPKEIELLYFLASSPNKVFTREQLLDNIWGYDFIGDTRTVDVHVKRIREKIGDNDRWAINTVWGVGYKFETR